MRRKDADRNGTKRSKPLVVYKIAINSNTTLSNLNVYEALE